MTDDKLALYSTQNGATTIFILTLAMLIINSIALVIHHKKSTYKCACFRLMVGSVLSSMFIANFICFSCNVILIFVVYLKMTDTYTMRVYSINKFLSVWAEFVSIIHILLLSLQRYVAVLYPFKINGFWMVCHAKVICFTVWISTLVVFIGLIVTHCYVDADLYHMSKLVQSYMVLVIILVLTYIYARIVVHLTRRQLNKNLQTSKANLRAVFISMALGIAFCVSYLPRSIHVILFYHSRLTWTVYLYIISYSFDALLIILKFLYEKYYLKENNKGGISPSKLSASLSSSTGIN